jgi:flagellar hook-length control protein FliK
MSEISSATSASASSATASHRSGHGASRQGPASLFSSLFSLASASRLQPASDGASPAGTQGQLPGASDDGDPTAADAESNPLTNLLGWMDQTQDRQLPTSGKSEDASASDPSTGARLTIDALSQASPWQGLAIPLASATRAATHAVTGEQDPKGAPAALSLASNTAAAATTAAALATTPAKPLTTPSAGGPGIDITGMRPVAPGATLTAADMADLPTTRPAASSANALATPASALSTAAGAPASAPATTSVAVPLSAQAGLVQPVTPPAPTVVTAPGPNPATADPTGPGQPRATVHAQRETANTAATPSQTSGNLSNATPSTLPTPTAQATASTLPTPPGSSVGGRSGPTPQDRNGKTLSTERSTVALDERFARTQAETTTMREGRVDNTAQPSAEQPGTDAAPQSRVDLAPLTSSAAATDAARTADARTSDPAALPSDAEPTSVSHWSTQHLRHASLRVGEGTQDAIDIQLSMDGKELNVDFRTDSAEARATLSQQADQSLGNLLERSGIQLGGVSVGAQQQHGQPPRPAPQANPTPSGPPAGAQDSGPQVPGSAPRGQLAARQDSSRPLDLFV